LLAELRAWDEHALFSRRLPPGAMAVPNHRDSSCDLTSEAV